MLQKELSASFSSVFRGTRFVIAGPLLVMAGFISSANAGIYLSPLGVYETGETDEDAAEIVAHDPLTQRLFVVNGFTKGIDVLNISNPDNPVKIDDIDLKIGGRHSLTQEMDYNIAAKVPRKLLEKNANNPIVLNNLAWLYDQKDDGRAIEIGEP